MQRSRDVLLDYVIWLSDEGIVAIPPLGEVEGDLYRPSTGGPHPGVVVCLGVVPFGVDHPQVPRLEDALARAAFVALIHWSPAMRDLHLEAEASRRSRSRIGG